MPRTVAAAGPSRSEAPCACPSESRSPGSAARTRGCRRSRRRPRLLGRGSGRGRRLEVGALDLAGLVDLEHVALFEVVVAVQEDAALEALLDLAGVVLEALQLPDPRLVDDGAVAHHTHLRAATDGAARDVGAGDRAEPGDAEELAHLDLAQRGLHRHRAQHADERLLDVVGELVDHTVSPDLDALAIGERPRLRVRPHVEADHHRVRGRGEHDVVLRDPADALVDHAHAYLRVLDLRELGDRRLDGADHAALEDEVEILDGALLHPLEQRFERDAAAALGELLPAQALGAGLRVMARVALVLDHARDLAGGRRMVEAEDLHRVARLRVLQLLASEVVERAYLPPGVACHDRVADV